MKLLDSFLIGRECTIRTDWIILELLNDFGKPIQDVDLWEYVQVAECDIQKLENRSFSLTFRNGQPLSFLKEYGLIKSIFKQGKALIEITEKGKILVEEKRQGLRRMI